MNEQTYKKSSKLKSKCCTCVACFYDHNIQAETDKRTTRQPYFRHRPVSLKMPLLSSRRSSYTLVPATSRRSLRRWESGAVAIWLIWNQSFSVSYSRLKNQITLFISVRQIWMKIMISEITLFMSLSITQIWNYSLCNFFISYLDLKLPHLCQFLRSEITLFVSYSDMKLPFFSSTTQSWNYYSLHQLLSQFKSITAPICLSLLFWHFHTPGKAMQAPLHLSHKFRPWLMLPFRQFQYSLLFVRLDHVTRELCDTG